MARFCGIQQAESVMLHVPFQCFQHFSSTHAETYWFGEFSQQVACAFTERWRSTHTWSLHPRRFPSPCRAVSIIHCFQVKTTSRRSTVVVSKNKNLFQSSFSVLSLLFSFYNCFFFLNFSYLLVIFFFLNNSNFIFERERKNTKLNFKHHLCICHLVSLLLFTKQNKKKLCTKEVFVYTLIIMGLN